MSDEISILLIEDDPAHAEAIFRSFDSQELLARIKQARTVKEFKELCAKESFDAIIMDLNLPDGKALNALSEVKHSCPVIVMTSFGNEKIAVAAMKAGARDYIVKSPEAFAEMPNTVGRAIREWKLELAKKHAEDALRESEERFRLISGILTDYVFTVNIDDNGSAELVFATDSFYEATGRTVGESSSFDSWISVIHPEDHQRFSDFYASVLASNVSASIVCRSFRKSGLLSWIEINAKPIYDETKKRVTTIVGAVKDITQNKVHELVNQARNRILELATTKQLDDVLEATLDEAELLTGSLVGFYHFVEADQKTVALQNWSTRTKAQFCKASGKGSHYPIDKAGIWVECVTQHKAVMVNDYAAHPGKKGLPQNHAPVDRFISVPIFRNNKVVAILGVGNKPHDYTDLDMETVQFLAEIAWEITEIKRKEEQFRLSEENARALFENSPISIWVEDFSEVKNRLDYLKTRGVANWREYFDLHPEELAACAARIRIIEVNKTTVEFFEAASKEDVPKNLPSYFTDETIPVFREELISLAEGKGHFRGEIVIQTPNGSKKTLFMALAVVDGYEDTWKKVIVSFNDMTDRKKAEVALTESERRLNTLMSNLPGMAYRCQCDENWTLLFANEGIYDLTGYERDKFFGPDKIDFASVIHEEDRAMVDEKINAAVDEKKSFQLEYRIVTEKGDVKWVWEQGMGIFDERGRLLFLEGFISDITDKKHAESEIIRGQKLESIGILAGGIAHDFNNILSGILGNISLARIEAQNGESCLETLADAEKASQRAKVLTKQLLTFARGGQPVKQESSIREIVEESASFVFRGSNIKFKPVFHEPLYSIVMDTGQISQVMNNIFINAMQATPLGGIVEADVENIELSEAGVNALPAGKYVRVSISDCGVGIPDDYLAKVFDPYFSTKVKGSGLGLATAYSIVKQHGGIISIESVPGKGTTFRTLLPATGKYAEKQASKDIEIKKGRGRILVVDDEKMVLKVASRMLDKLGYEYEGVEEGRKGIDLYLQRKKEGAPFDAVILDLTIPGGMGGMDTMNELRKIEPNIRAIVSSGYSDSRILSRYGEYGFKGIVPKPFNIEELSSALDAIFKK